jgi:hypothetical protein
MSTTKSTNALSERTNEYHHQEIHDDTADDDDPSQQQQQQQQQQKDFNSQHDLFIFRLPLIF